MKVKIDKLYLYNVQKREFMNKGKPDYFYTFGFKIDEKHFGNGVSFLQTDLTKFKAIENVEVLIQYREWTDKFGNKREGLNFRILDFKRDNDDVFEVKEVAEPNIFMEKKDEEIEWEKINESKC